MTMYFYNSIKVHFIFTAWDVSSNLNYGIALSACFVFGVFIEAVNVFINRLEA